jgi:uncharacterized protein with NRDE domain
MKNIINKLKKLLLEFKGYYLNERMYQRLCYYIDDIEKQQEKVSKLLDLYRLSQEWIFANSDEWKELTKQIKTLEEELGI